MDRKTLIGVAIGLALGFLASVVLMQPKPAREARAPDPASAAADRSR